ncbi:hypothetical protein, partial [Moorena sp. SIO4A1]|uniref:hypothetical protein n=1 Tax=Moorena sp. SIO4A1 TaxID=2607835 RepID=UPI0025F488CE
MSKKAESRSDWALLEKCPLIKVSSFCSGDIIDLDLFDLHANRQMVQMENIINRKIICLNYSAKYTMSILS